MFFSMPEVYSDLMCISHGIPDGILSTAVSIQEGFDMERRQKYQATERIFQIK